MIRAVVLAVAALALLAADRDPLAGRAAGKPQSCMSLGAATDGPMIVDPHTILYRSGSRIYRTGPQGPCPSLRPFNTLIVEVYGGQICRGDRFRVKEPNSIIPSGACLFTDFTPYSRAK